MPERGTDPIDGAGRAWRRPSTKGFIVKALLCAEGRLFHPSGCPLPPPTTLRHSTFVEIGALVFHSTPHEPFVGAAFQGTRPDRQLEKRATSLAMASL